MFRAFAGAYQHCSLIGRFVLCFRAQTSRRMGDVVIAMIRAGFVVDWKLANPDRDG